MKDFEESILIYKTEDGKTHIDVKLQDETIWLTQDMIMKLFGSSKANISEHISNIYKEQELSPEATVRKIRTVRKEGNRNVSRELDYYNLDMIISVGYRVNSARATEFRIWATSVLKRYLTEGYAVNEKLLKAQQEKLEKIQNVITLISTSVQEKISNLEDAKELLTILNDFSKGLGLLDDYDHRTLDTHGVNKRNAVFIEEQEFLNIVEKMKANFESDLFGRTKDESFSSSVKQVYQSFDGKDLYPTIEEKAATLLYLITKNHSFLDGNKRIAASCFLYFLSRNNLLYKGDHTTIIDNATLCSLTLLIAESKPEDMDVMKQVIVSVLNRNG